MTLIPCVGLFFLRLLYVILVPDEWDRQDAAALALHEDSLPTFLEEMDLGKAAYSEQDLDGAASHFFEAEQVAVEVDSATGEARYTYIEFDWDERHAQAVAGRASVAAEADDIQGAKAFLTRALELDDDVVIPVPSNSAEKLLLQVRAGESGNKKDTEDAIFDGAELVGEQTSLATGPGSFAEARVSYMANLSNDYLGSATNLSYFFLGGTDLVTGFKIPPKDERDAKEAVLMFQAEVEMPGQPSLQGIQKFSVGFQRTSSGWRVIKRQVFFGDMWIDLTGDAASLLPSGNFPK